MVDKKIQHIILVAKCLLVAILAMCTRMPLAAQDSPLINPGGLNVGTRFRVPGGYERVTVDEKSFAYYLRHLRMLPVDSPAVYFDGSEKPNDNIYVGVLAMDVEDLLKDAQFCIRLRGEYLFEQQQYAKIAFTIVNRHRVPYVKWAEGLELTVKDKTYWTKSNTEIDRYRTFRRYLDFIFTNSDIATLLSDVQPVAMSDIMPGDMLVQTARPGHVVLVLDVAENPVTGDCIYLLGQSYKPAQTPQVLMNPNNDELSPWYSISTDDKIPTPEYLFYKRDLRRFREVIATPPAAKKKNPVFYF